MICPSCGEFEIELPDLSPVCVRCLLKRWSTVDDFDADELGLDPEEEFDA